MMKTVCPICKQETTSTYHASDRATYFRCANCGTIYQYPLPTTAEMIDYANAEYQTGVYKAYLNADEIKYATFEYRLDRLLTLLEPVREPGAPLRILDVGCANGRFIEVAVSRGLDAWGIEFAESAIGAASPHIRSRIHQADANAIDRLDLGKFDVITAFDLIEHLFDPVGFLSSLRHLLVARGSIVLTTPDSGSIWRLLMGGHWPMLQPFQHTILLSRKSAAILLGSARFASISIRSTRKVFTLDYLFGQLQAPTPSIYRAYTKMQWLLPRRLRETKIQIGIGEMMIAATPLGE